MKWVSSDRDQARSGLFKPVCMQWWCSRLIKKQSRAAASTAPWEHTSTNSKCNAVIVISLIGKESNEPRVITPSLLHSADKLLLFFTLRRKIPAFFPESLDV